MTGLNACLLSIYSARNWALKLKAARPDLKGHILEYWCVHTLPGLFAWGPGDGVRPRPGVDKYGP